MLIILKYETASYVDNFYRKQASNDIIYNNDEMDLARRDCDELNKHAGRDIRYEVFEINEFPHGLYTTTN